MCINCLNTTIEDLNEYEKDISVYRDSIECLCCRGFPNFTIGVSQDLRVLCNVKIKKRDAYCLHSFYKLENLEESIKLKVKNKLTNAMETLDDVSHEISEIQYLTKVNELKKLNDLMGHIESQDHR